ncbi:uvrABC system B domain protein [Staphylococcus aureus]|nr:uvrABC system B domain protein [Staphylococcus aureus]
MVEHYPFKIHSDFEPQGDQPQAIEEIVKVLKREKTSNFIRCYWHRENIYDE